MTNTITDIANLLKGDLYLRTDGNMHGGSIILSKKGYNKNAKLAKMTVNEKLKGDQNVIDFILNNIASIEMKGDYYFVRLNDNDSDSDSLVVEFTSASGFSDEASEFFLKA